MGLLLPTSVPTVRPLARPPASSLKIGLFRLGRVFIYWAEQQPMSSRASARPNCSPEALCTLPTACALAVDSGSKLSREEGGRVPRPNDPRSAEGCWEERGVQVGGPGDKRRSGGPERKAGVWGGCSLLWRPVPRNFSNRLTEDGSGGCECRNLSAVLLSQAWGGGSGEITIAPAAQEEAATPLKKVKRRRAIIEPRSTRERRGDPKGRRPMSSMVRDHRRPAIDRALNGRTSFGESCVRTTQDPGHARPSAHCT
jgi:hypothetical protein